jgi:hypothetical protein
MANVRIIFDGARMEEIMHGPNGVLGRWMVTRAEIVKQAAVMQCNKKTGRLSRGILKRPVESDVGGLSIRIIASAKDPSTGVDYAAYVHEGTKPHEIRPKDPKGWLAFEVNGTTVFAKVVNHPGYAGNKFLSDNLKLFAP